MTESILPSLPSTPPAHLITTNFEVLEEVTCSNVSVIANTLRISAICSATKAKSLDIGALTKIWPFSILPYALWRHKQSVQKLKLCYKDEHCVYVRYIVNKMIC
jgi:hypothetical protein